MAQTAAEIRKAEEQNVELTSDRLTVLSRMRWKGYLKSIGPVAEKLGVLDALAQRVTVAVMAREKAIAECKAAKKHWEPKNFVPKEGQKPKCNRCGARIDLAPIDDPNLRYREWCELLESKAAGVEPGRLPYEGELRDAGFFKPDHAVPGYIKEPFSLVWHPIIVAVRHDITGLTAAVRLARLDGALGRIPRDGEDPGVLASARNETGRRWSF